MSVIIKSRWTGEPIATVDDTDDLREAVIRLVKQGVSLANANLVSANLRSANLQSADLRSANLRSADLEPVRDDLFAVLSYSPAEVLDLIEALEQGRVNGSTYSDGECGCLVGTLAIAGGADPRKDSECSSIHGLAGNSSRPIERFFLCIKKGDTPENNQAAKLAHEWASEWLARMQAAFGKEGHGPQIQSRR